MNKRRLNQSSKTIVAAAFAAASALAPAMDPAALAKSSGDNPDLPKAVLETYYQGISAFKAGDLDRALTNLLFCFERSQ